MSTSKKVFVIHGHDQGNLDTLKGILRDKFDLEPVILKETPSGGDSVIEKFERVAAECCFAVVLLTPDDNVKERRRWWTVKTSEGEWQPRPNVLFELGWFCGSLGRRNIMFLCKQGTKLPSDFDHVVETAFEHSVSENDVISKIELELSHAGVLD